MIPKPSKSENNLPETDQRICSDYSLIDKLWYLWGKQNKIGGQLASQNAKGFLPAALEKSDIAIYKS